MTTSTKRINITLPADWHAEFTQQAQSDGLTLSEWICECAVANLPDAKQQQLSTRIRRGRPSKSTADK